METNIYDPKYVYTQIFGQKMAGHTQHWPDIDLDELKQINEDCIGWIHLDDSPVNYPVVRGHLDKGYYYTHNFSCEPETVHGAVFMYFMHEGQIRDTNTFFSAHHMRDWSMFRAILEYYQNPSFLDGHRTIDLIINGVRYDADVFAAYSLHMQNDKAMAYKYRFRNEAEFNEWISWIKARNVLNSGIDPCFADKLVTFNTCIVSDGFHQCHVVAVLREKQ